MDQWYGSYHLGMYGSWVWIGAFWDAAIYRYISFLIIYNCLRGGTNIWLNQPVSGKKDTGNGNGEHSMWLLANTWWTWLKHTHTFWPFSHAWYDIHGISIAITEEHQPIWSQLRSNQSSLSSNQNYTGSIQGIMDGSTEHDRSYTRKLDNTNLYTNSLM